MSSHITTIIVIIFVAAAATASTSNTTIVFTIPEGLPIDHKVGSLANASKSILNTNRTDLLYGFLPGSEEQTLFSINDQSGDLYTSVVIDRESICEYSSVCFREFDVSVKSQDGFFFRVVTVKIEIEDENDNVPLFPHETFTISIQEGTQVNSTFRIEPAVDMDTGANNSIQDYLLVADSETDGIFGLSVNKNLDGTLLPRLRLDKVLDREVRDTYNVKVIARDGGQPPNTGVLNVVIKVEDINDNAPTFTKNRYNVTVSESTAAYETILTLSALDKDVGENSRIIYRISEFTKNKDIVEQLFSLNEVTGDIQVKSDLTSVAGKTYDFIVEAVDHGLEPLFTQAQVVVFIEDSGNNPPIVTVSLSSSGNMRIVNVNENALNGTFVAHVNVEDSDNGPNGEVSCQVSNLHFGIEELGGKGFKVVVRAVLDREVLNIHNITVTCSDNGTPALSGSTSFLVRVTDKNDNKPVFEKSVYTASIRENNKGDEIILQVSALDADEGQNAVVHYAAHEDSRGTIIVDSNTGLVSVNKVFDREESSVVPLFILAVDSGDTPLTGTATVSLSIEDVNDNPPKFLKTVHGFKVMENQPTGTNVAVLEADDADSGVNAEFDFAIAPEFIDKVPFILFSDGLLKANKQLDREERSRYDFVAIVTDHGENPLSSLAHVTVVVDDANDNAPVISFPRPSNNSVTTWYPDYETDLVATIEAYDIDEGVNKELEYSIKSGNQLGIFDIDSYTGEIIFVSKIDIGSDKVIELEISVKDKAEKPLETVKKLFVELKYTNATFLQHSDGESTSTYIIISIVVVLVTLVISGVIIGVILFLRTMDKKRKQKNADDSNVTDSDFGFTITQSHTILSTDTLSSGSSEAKKKEVSFILDTSDCVDYHQQKQTNSMAALVDKPSKSSLRYLTPPPGDLGDSGLDMRELQNEANSQLQSLKLQQMMLQNRAQQWVQSQQIQYGDHHSDGSADTIGSDSGRGCSEEDDMFSTPSADDPKAFDISSPESQRSYLPPQPDMYTDLQQRQHQEPYVKQPWTRKPHLAQKDFKPTLSINRNIGHNMNPVQYTDRYLSDAQTRVSWGGGPYGAVMPMDYTGDSQLHSFFDKTPVTMFRDDEDNCSTTTSGSYTIYSEEIL